MVLRVGVRVVTSVLGRGGVGNGSVMFADGGNGNNLSIAVGGLEGGRRRLAGPCKWKVLSDWNVLAFVGIFSLRPAVVACRLGGQRVLALKRV